MTPAYPMQGTLVHPSLGPVRYQITEVSDDPDTQVAQTIALMRRYAVEDSSNPTLIREVQSTTAGDPIDDTWRYLARRDGIRSMAFVHDETTGTPWSPWSTDLGQWRPLVETLMRPVDQATCPVPQGDCDDFSMYGAAHLLARGVDCSYCTVAADDKDPSIYSHVYLVAYPSTGQYAGQRVPLDLSHGPYPGWETANRFGKRKEWSLTGLDGPTLATILAIVGPVGWLLYKLGGRAW